LRKKFKNNFKGTIVPVNGESLVSFLSEEEGKKCSICPDLGINEVPTMACAVEVTPNDIENLDIGCHKCLFTLLSLK